MGKKQIAFFCSCFLVFAVFAEKNLIKRELINSENMQSINLMLSFETVEIQEYLSSDDVTIEIYSNNKEFIPAIKFADSVLAMKSVPINFWNLKIHISCKVIIYIPSGKKLDKVHVGLSSGSLKMSNINVNKIKLTSTSGSISTQNISAQDFVLIESTSGSIKCDELKAKNSVKAHSSSGSINIGSVESDTIVCESTSGSIKIDELYCDYADLHSTSGSLKAHDIAANYFDFSTTSGSIFAEFEIAPSADSSINSTSGSVEIIVPETENYKFHFSSNSGTLRNKIENTRKSIRNGFTYTKTQSPKGGSPAQINVHTTSGNITLDD